MKSSFGWKRLPVNIFRNVARRREDVESPQARERYELLKQICSLNRRMSWLHRIQGVDISRAFEYTEALVRLRSVPYGCLLDIGSYRSPFPMFMAQRGYRVFLLDIDPAISQQTIWARKVLDDEASWLAVQADGTRLPFPDLSFDAVSCISTIEHFPGDGDILMAREIGRVLRSGGGCFLSFPYSTVARDGKWGRWFQRWYDLPTANARLIQPSGLSLVAHGFLIGGIIGKIADIWYAQPRLLRHALSWSHIFLFPTAFRKDTPSQYDARILWLFLQR
ncbi:MAG: class I SAM-dependent methyltransferase [Anaerolineae bacterium]